MSRPLAAGLATGALAAALAVVIVVTEEEVPVPETVGFTNNSVAQGIATPAESAAMLAGAGAEIDRVQVDWDRFEPAPGRYEFGPYDEIYAADLAAGIQPLFVLGFAPAWAATGTCAETLPTCHLPPAAEHYEAFASALAALAERYPRAVALEVWNEPNTAYFWGPAADPEAYASLLEAAYASVKAVAPEMPVLGGSTSSSPPGTGKVVAPEFLERIYATGAGESMDAVSVHVYPEANDTTAATAVEWLEEIIEVGGEQGISKPIWVTETGASTTGPWAATESEQRTILLRLTERLAGIAEVEMMLVHTLFQPPGPPESPEPGFGVVTAGGEPTEAYCDLARLWGGGGCEER